MRQKPRTFRVGAVTISILVESQGPLLRPSELYPDATPEQIMAECHWLTPRFYDPTSDRLVIAIQSFLLRSEGKTILVDTCVGDCKARVRHDFNQVEWNWLAQLHAAGVSQDEIDIVLSTHLHVDHVGWNTHAVNGQWVPTFPKARYLFIQPEYEFWRSEIGDRGLERTGDYIEDSVRPIFDAGLADLVAPDQRIDPAIRLIHTPGHTPGHVCVEIDSEGERAVISGDLFHHPLQCRFPHWSTRFCVDPEESRATRKAFLAQHAEQETLLFPSHFPAPTSGRLVRTGTETDVSYAYQFTDTESV